MLNKEKIINLLKKKNENDTINITVVDNNKELPDFRKIAVPDLKQYLIKGYEEIRQVKKEKEELEEKIEEAKKYEHLYKASLVTANEYEKRCEETNELLKKYKSKLAWKNKEYDELEEELNDYKIQENELKKKQEEIEKIVIDRSVKAIDEYKEKLIKELNNYKGNISKSKLINIIEGVKMC